MEPTSRPGDEQDKNEISFRKGKSACPWTHNLHTRFSSDHSLLIELGQDISIFHHRRVRAILNGLLTSKPAGVTNIHPAYASVLVSFDPQRTDPASLRHAIDWCITNLEHIPLEPPRRVDIPVCYQGEFAPDLDEVARFHGLDPAQVIHLHTSGSYFVFFLGFSPGFPYLGGLSPQLATPRRSSPRLKVTAGSVAIGGKQTGIYPVSTPGGWQIIGRTPAGLFQPNREPATLVQIGDRIRFCSIGLSEFHRLASIADRPSMAATLLHGLGVVEVLAGGLCTTIQDLGRPGLAHLGVSACGAADPVALRLGNWLVGNPPGDAAIEMALSGGVFRFTTEATISLTGAPGHATINGKPIAIWSTQTVRPGQVLTVENIPGRVYLCVRGGISCPPVLGSAATHLASAIGGLAGRPLRSGDWLEIGPPPEDPPQQRRISQSQLRRLYPSKALRVTAGAQAGWFGSTGLRTLCANAYKVTSQSDRVGLRLEGAALHPTHKGQLLTQGVPLGAIQVPTNGLPIVLFVDHQTTGGYPQVASVITADLHRLGQLQPLCVIRFELSSLAAAIRARIEIENHLASITGGQS